MCSISGVRRGRTGALAAAPLRPTCAFRSNRMACVSVDISVIHCPSVARPRSSFPSRFASVTVVTAINAVTAPPGVSSTYEMPHSVSLWGLVRAMGYCRFHHLTTVINFKIFTEHPVYKCVVRSLVVLIEANSWCFGPEIFIEAETQGRCVPAAGLCNRKILITPCRRLSFI
ncbi:hypothetical protein QTP88_019518 [Uroleucon formosanum]